MASTKSKEARAAQIPSATASTQNTPSKAPSAPVITEQELKHFVLDTNVLLHNPNAPFVFKEHHVVIPFAVIEELDKLKRGNDDVGRNARECIRHLDKLRARGRLIEGVRWGES